MRSPSNVRMLMVCRRSCPRGHHPEKPGVFREARYLGLGAGLGCSTGQSRIHLYALTLLGQIQPLNKQESHNYLFQGTFPVVSRYFCATELSSPSCEAFPPCHDSRNSTGLAAAKSLFPLGRSSVWVCGKSACSGTSWQSWHHTVAASVPTDSSSG